MIVVRHAQHVPDSRSRRGTNGFWLALGERMGSGGDAETTRRVLDVVENIVGQIQHGYKLAVVPADDEHPDAVPELTRALRPELAYTYLVHRPHNRGVGSCRSRGAG